jgi:hypothetical protein
MKRKYYPCGNWCGKIECMNKCLDNTEPKMKGSDWDKIQKYLHKMEIVEEQKLQDGTIRIKGHPKLAAVREALNWLSRNFNLTPKNNE